MVNVLHREKAHHRIETVLWQGESQRVATHMCDTIGDVTQSCEIGSDSMQPWLKFERGNPASGAIRQESRRFSYPGADVETRLILFSRSLKRIDSL